MSDTLSHEEQIRFLETFINTEALAKLEKEGVLKKKGSSTWYHVLKPADVPREIACVPNQMSQADKNGKKTVLWKFPTATEIKRARSLLAKFKQTKFGQVPGDKLSKT
ncbi:MAG TPA: hypothetical protein VGE29_11485 [Prosthecobacter sp.]